MVLDRSPAVRAAMYTALRESEHLLLHFDGPVCDMSVLPTTDIIRSLHRLLASQDVQPPRPVTASPYDLLRFILATCPQLTDRAEAEVAAYEVRAAAVARTSRIRFLLQVAQITIIGNACPAAIDTFLARLYRRERDRIRLIIARHGADPALLEPTPVPVLQAAGILAAAPSACVVVASAPAGIQAARRAGAHVIGYAPEPTTRQLLTAAGAEVTIGSMPRLAGSVHLAALRRKPYG
jgi:hypothetical protein